LQDWKPQFLIWTFYLPKKANSEKLGLWIDNTCRIVSEFAD
jgi:hypothetical protein